MRTELLFALGPYAAAAVFMAGVLVRLAIASRGDDAPSPRARIFAGSILLLLIAHLAGAAFPQKFLAWNRAPLRLYALEGVLFATGVVALAAACAVLIRLLRNRELSRDAIADTAAAALIAIVAASGLIVAILYRWASSWGVAVFPPYVNSILRLAPRAALFDSMPFAVRLHVFSAFVALALLPLTSAGRIAVGAVRRRAQAVAAFAESRLSAVAAALLAWAERHDLAGRLWPEEED